MKLQVQLLLVDGFVLVEIAGIIRVKFNDLKAAGHIEDLVELARDGDLDGILELLASLHTPPIVVCEHCGEVNPVGPCRLQVTIPEGSSLEGFLVSMRQTDEKSLRRWANSPPHMISEQRRLAARQILEERGTSWQKPTSK